MAVDSSALAKAVRQSLADWIAGGGAGMATWIDWPRCEHRRQELRLKITAAGSRLVQTQCLECGCRLGGLSIREAERQRRLGDLPPFDEDLWPERMRRMEAFRKWQLDQREKAQQEVDAAWVLRYESFLRSPRWQELRQLVMKRAGGTCEGCGIASAVQVHHVVYPTQYGRQFGQEMLWELRAVCLACHEVITAGQSTQKGTVA